MRRVGSVGSSWDSSWCATARPMRRSASPICLVERMHFGVPRAAGTGLGRSVYAWARHDDLPSAYHELPACATPRQARARAEAQDGYRKAVQGRVVVETLFDALAFFEWIDPRLAAPDPPSMRWAFAEGLCDLPSSDPNEGDCEAVFIARPLGLDWFDIFLPYIACRHFERRMARWPAADGWLAEEARRARRTPPSGGWRELRHVLRSEGRVVGYSGMTRNGPIQESWVERRAQVWRDVRAGHPYFVLRGQEEIAVTEAGHEKIAAIDHGGIDVLEHLAEPMEWGFGFERLEMLEDYADLYLDMRRNT